MLRSDDNIIRLITINTRNSDQKLAEYNSKPNLASHNRSAKHITPAKFKKHKEILS